MTTGIGSFSAQKAVGQHHSQLTRSMGACGASILSAGADDLCAAVQTQPLTESAREAAIARAGAAMEAAYAHYKRTRNEDDLNRAYRHLGQMLALARMGQGARSR